MPHIAFFARLVSLSVLLAITPKSFAEIFKCIDKETGKMAFTDQACPDDKPGVYQPIGATNIDSGFDESDAARKQKARKNRAGAFERGWKSQNSEASAREKAKSRQRKQDQDEREREYDRERYGGGGGLDNKAAKRQKERRDQKREDEKAY